MESDVSLILPFTNLAVIASSGKCCNIDLTASYHWFTERIIGGIALGLVVGGSGDGSRPYDVASQNWYRL